MTTATATFNRAEAAARLATVRNRIEDLQSEEAALIAQIIENTPMGKTEAGDWVVSISTSRRLDTKRLEERFPVTQYPHLYRPVINTPAVRENFSPIELRQFETETSPSVKVS